METRPAVHVSGSVWPLVIFTGLAWGSGGLLSKGLVDGGVDPFTVTAGPFLVAGVVAWFVAWRSGSVRRDAIAAGVALGAVASGLPALFFNIAYETLPAGLVTLILSLGPVITAGAAHAVFDDERFTRAKGLGLLLAFGGVGLLVFAPGVIEGASYRGAAWTLAGAVIAGSTAILVRRYAVRYGALALVAPQLTAAGLTPIVVGTIVGRQLVPMGGFTAGTVFILALIGVGASYAGFRAILLANEIGTTGQVAMVSYLIPLVGVSGGIVFFGERLTGWIIAGAVLILAGVVLGGHASRPNRIVRASG